MGGRVILLFANLLATPFTIRLLGPSRYGLWALLQLSFTWAVLADVGMASASTKYGADRYAHGDNEGESAVVWTALCVTGLTTGCVATVVGVEAPAVLSQLLHIHGQLFSPGVLALRLVCALFVAQAVSGTVNTPQVVRLRWREYTVITTTSGLIMSIGAPVALAIFSGGVVTVAAVGFAAATLGALGNLYLAGRFQRSVRRPRVSKAVLRQLLAYGGTLMVTSLASIPLMTAERVSLAHNHSTAVVAYYAVAATLGTTLFVLPEQLVQPLLPGLARLEAAGRHDEHRDLYSKSLVGLYLILTPAAIMLAFLAHPFLSLWAGPLYGAHSTGPFLVIVVGVWFNALARVPVAYFLSSARTKVIAYIQVAEVVPYVVAAYLLTDAFGAIGAAAVWSARLVVESLLCFAFTRRVAPQLPFSPLSERPWRSVAAPLALGCVAGAAAMLSHGLVLRLLWAAGLGFIYLVTTWRLVLTARERDGLLSLVAEVTRRRPRATTGT